MPLIIPPNADPEKVAFFGQMLNQYSLTETRERYEDGLLEFMQGAWSSLENSPFQSCWAIEAMCDHLEAVTLGYIPRLLINIPPRCTKTTLCSIVFPAWVWARSDISFLSGPQVRFLCASYGHTLALDASNKSRRLLTSPWFQKHWPGRIVFQSDQNTKTDYANTAGGARRSTSVGGSLLGLGGDILIADDLNNTEQVESEAERANVSTFWNEFHTTRLNSPDKSAIICIQQRLHEQDVSGQILESDEDWVHLCYDAETEILTKEGWFKFDSLPEGIEVMGVDPQTLQGRWEKPTQYIKNKYDGVLINYHSAVADLCVTPDHRMVYFDSNDMRKATPQKWAVGRVRPAATTPKDFYLPQAIRWSGSKTKRVFFGGRYWSPMAFAEFMGWYLAEGCANGAARTTKIVQLGTGKHVSDLERVMKSVPFHVGKYRTGSKGMFSWQIKDRTLAPALAKLGKSKNKFVPSILKELPPKYLRAFILAFARGDGGAAGRNGHGIQMSSRSKVLIDDLQECAVKAGWATSVHCREGGERFFNGYVMPAGTQWVLYLRTSKKAGRHRKWYSRLRGVNTTERPYKGDVYCVSVPSSAIVVRRNGRVAVSGNCIPMRYDDTRPYVTVKLPQYDSPEPYNDPRTEEGELMWPERFNETVVRQLEASLGPYLAAGRLQQLPVPKGGGIIQRKWWQLWDGREAQLYGLEWNGGRKEFPHFELVVGSLDTSYGEKQENDFNAFTVWGIWIDRNKNRRAMLMFAWAKRLPLHGTVVSALLGEAKVNFEARQREAFGLVELVADTARRYKINRLLIEDKTRGRDVAQEINRLYARENWGVQLVNPQGDKVSRTHSIVPLFTDGAVYAPETRWSEAVLTQCQSFPKAAHDDLHDTVTQFLSWARENGVLIRADEMTAALEDEQTYRGPRSSVAASYGV